MKSREPYGRRTAASRIAKLHNAVRTKCDGADARTASPNSHRARYSLRELEHVALGILAIAQGTGEAGVRLDRAHRDSLCDELGTQLGEITVDGQHELRVRFDLP